MKTIPKIALVLFLIGFAVSCKDQEATKEHKTTTEESQDVNNPEKQGQAFIEKDSVSDPNVLDVLTNSKDHTTLVKAIKTVGIENSMVNAGPLTVFAPTNEAFDKLPEGSLENLMKPENKAKLGYILKHHVTPGNYSKKLLKKAKKLGQASDQNVLVTVKGDDVFIDGAKIMASIPASNGIIYVVDKVIVPEK